MKKILLIYFIVIFLPVYAEETKNKRTFFDFKLFPEKKHDFYEGNKAIFFNAGYDSLIKTNIGAHLLFGDVRCGFLYGAIGWDIDLKLGRNGYSIDLGRAIYLTNPGKSMFLNPIGAGASGGISFVKTWDVSTRYDTPINAVVINMKFCICGLTLSTGAYRETSEKTNIYRFGIGFGF